MIGERRGCTDRGGWICVASGGAGIADLAGRQVRIRGVRHCDPVSSAEPVKAPLATVECKPKSGSGSVHR